MALGVGLCGHPRLPSSLWRRAALFRNVDGYFKEKAFLCHMGGVVKIVWVQTKTTVMSSSSLTYVCLLCTQKGFLCAHHRADRLCSGRLDQGVFTPPDGKVLGTRIIRA